MRYQVQFYPALALSAAFLLLVMLAAQYPLSTTFPIGGDAASYNRSAKTILAVADDPTAAWSVIRSSNYPLGQIIYTASSLTPLSWPARFTATITIAHVLAGLALALLLARLGGWPAAAAGLALWSLTAITINSHLEDATFAQLISLPFMLLAIERAISGSPATTLALLIITTLTHPLSGLVLFLTLAIGTLPFLAIMSKLSPPQLLFVRAITVSTILLTLLAIVKLLLGINWPFGDIEPQPYLLIDLIKSPFAPILALTIPGVAILASRIRHKPFSAAFPLSFIWLALLLANNSHLGIGVAENRFRTYLITAAVLAAALALPRLISAAFLKPIPRAVFVSVLLLSLATLTWRENASVYAFYEDPNNNARLVPAAVAAIQWAGLNLPPGSHIATTAASRHSEWVPVLTDHKWTELNSSHQLLINTEQELADSIRQLPFTHFISFTKREDPQANLSDQDAYPIVFQNDDVTIIQLQ